MRNIDAERGQRAIDSFFLPFVAVGEQRGVQPAHRGGLPERHSQAGLSRLGILFAFSTAALTGPGLATGEGADTLVRVPRGFAGRRVAEALHVADLRSDAAVEERTGPIQRKIMEVFGLTLPTRLHAAGKEEIC